jgi:hypothetical protein
MPIVATVLGILCRKNYYTVYKRLTLIPAYYSDASSVSNTAWRLLAQCFPQKSELCSLLLPGAMARPADALLGIGGQSDATNGGLL